MEETTYIYIVHSDINENNIYAEFETEEEAIDYARRHKDELTYVDKVEAALDEDGDIIEMFDSETIWVYDEEDDEEDELTDEEIEELIQADEDRKWAEADLGDTTWFEDLDTEALVEKMEENEDMVECKECFELFPKVDGVKLSFGYICPCCHKALETSEVTDAPATDYDFFSVDFPEVGTPAVATEEPECVGPECEAPVEAPVTKEETVATLVKDEEEAIAGYDKAKIEIEANPELTPEEKEEALEVIEHIKEEEVEHIEELEELVDTKEEESENDPISEVEVAEPLNEAWELGSARITDEVKTVGRLVKGTFVVIGFKDAKEQTNFRGEYEYNLDTKKLKLKDVAFKFSPKHIKEIEAQLKADIDEHLDDNGKFVVMDSTEVSGWSELEAGESTESTPLDEHVNEEHPAIESEQELEGTDNAVVDCEVADVITHSEDEKPLNCDMKDKPLEKPLTEEVSSELTEVEFTKMENYLRGGKYRSLDTEWTEEYDADHHFAIDEIGVYLSYSDRYLEYTLGVSVYHASKDNNAEYPERYTDEDEYSAATIAELYEDEDAAIYLKRLYKDNLDKLIKIEEETHAKYAKPEGDRVAAFNNALEYAKKEGKPFIYGYTNHTGKFFAAEQPMKVSGRPVDAEKEFKSRYKNCSVIYVVYPDKDFLKESYDNLYNFTEAEMQEFDMDEEGYSLSGYDHYIRCNWCQEVYSEYDCKFEANLGWLCPRCQEEVRYHGGPLTIVEDPTEEQIQATLEEAIKMTRDELLDKEGTTDVELINAGRPEEERVELVEE